ncbi:arylamine N-acetyltransferase [Bacillus gobiensis]|uniref:arylamine N-acetyltransferase n=1 Tax=Bacillus gobiensis TaxID=1441095 RepID=UPI003D22882A
MNTTQLPNWAQSYMKYIQVPIKKPSYEYLAEICKAHLNKIPFENISTLLAYRDYDRTGWLIPNEEQFVDQLYKYHMGGTCYSINSNLLSLLKTLGFQCRYAQLGSIHAGILVQVPETEESVYVDCGTAAPLFKPLRFETTSRPTSTFGDIEVVIVPEKEEGVYTFQRYVDKKLIKQTLWTFDTKKDIQFHDFQTAINEYFEPGTQFMNTLRCQVWQLEKERSLSLVNNILSIRKSDGKAEKHKLSSVDEIQNAVTEEFKLPKLPVKEAARVLERLGVDIFKEPGKDHRVNLG